MKPKGFQPLLVPLVNRSILKHTISRVACEQQTHRGDSLLLTQPLRIRRNHENSNDSIQRRTCSTQLKINNVYGQIATAISTIKNDRQKVFLLYVD